MHNLWSTMSNATPTLSAADIAEIHNLAALYCLTTDNADAEAFMKLWVAPEAFGGYDSGAFGKMETWQAMHDFETHHVGPGGMANGKRHLALNLAVEALNADEAHLTHDLVVLEVADVPRVIASGRYNRSLVVRTSAGWRFKRRTLDIDPGFFKLTAEAPAR